MTNVNSIKTYREQKGLSQDQLGESLGVTRQTIAAWEKGERTVSLVQLSKIAKTLGIALELLIGSTEEPATSAPAPGMGLMFRANQPSMLTPTLRAHLTQKSVNYSTIEQILGEVPTLPEMRPLTAYNEDVVEEVAKEIRDWLGVGETYPLGDVLALLEAKGLKIILYPLPETISGFSAYTETTGAVIFVNDNHPTERQFFTALHELGHLIFHRQEYNQSHNQTRKNDPREKAANHLAGAVLLSRDIIYRELRAYRNRWIPEPLLADIKRRYGVSLMTILYRAGQLGLITKKQQGQQIGVLKKKYGVNEKPKLPTPEHLTRLERLVFLALLREELTVSRAAEVLDKHLMDIRQQLANWMEENGD
ncbi:XRE family transcriptional regulator [Leptothoe spongobia]|uniref:ImmA/IrrE family metallo-endopeptidase n=1 Tax=Leptothoe spongobia TAU-MAC 1115 TaxID=1967444 RepID=A0A947GLY9_9CYAN|nr:XRE family transcriptional regulator [Leptothoe spongobia]MBT9317337.1 ImmA/IrrE family metallo-endopeptidase [Leptothoe spongobia TAU-MAC 1115]